MYVVESIEGTNCLKGIKRIGYKTRYNLIIFFNILITNNLTNKLKTDNRFYTWIDSSSELKSIYGQGPASLCNQSKEHYIN